MKRQMVLSGCLMVWLVYLCGMSCTIADDAKPTRTGWTVPFTIGSDGRMYVQGQVNHKIPATFLIDTGTVCNYLSDAIQDKLHLPLHGVTEDGTGKGTPTIIDGKQEQEITLSNVTVGGLPILDTPFLLLPANRLSESSSPSTHIDGIIGSNILDQCTVLLDFSSNTMLLYYPSGLTKQEIDSLNLRIVYTVPITRSPDNKDIWLAHATFSNEKAVAQCDMMIDTGASLTSIPSKTAEQLKLVGNGSATGTMFLNKKVSVMASQVTKMQMGDFVLFDHTVVYTEKAVPGYPISIGMDIFRKYIPLIDFGQGIMYLTYAKMGVETRPKK